MEQRSFVEATLAGAGIAMLPTYFAGDDLVRGSLVRNAAATTSPVPLCHPAPSTCRASTSPCP